MPVKQEWIEEVRVSTVFLGLDYNFGKGPLILWETMTFSNQAEWRYSGNAVPGAGPRRCTSGWLNGLNFPSNKEPNRKDN